MQWVRGILLFAAAMLTASCGTNRAGQAESADTPAKTQAVVAQAATSTTVTTSFVTPNGLSGEVAIADNFDGPSGIEPTRYGAGGSGGIPGASADDVGAFRMFCGAGQVLKDDPLVYPGKAGASHLHQFVGNLGTDANSTYSSLRTSGGTTCGQSATPFNRSAYWIPAMLDGTGNVVKPDFLNLYYKRLPASAPGCTDPIKRRGICIDLPNGVRYVFGYNMTTMSGGPADLTSFDQWFISFECWGSEDGKVGSGAATARYHTIKEVADAGCPVGAQLVILGFAEDCWDGVNLDTPDHRSHMVYATGEDKGYGRQCDAGHPYLIPDMQFQWHFTTDANFAKGLWRLSSDDMMAAMGKPVVPGSTMHMDYWEAWSPTVKKTWTDNCINGHLSCASGDLGNGTDINGAGIPSGGFPKHVLIAVPESANPVPAEPDPAPTPTTNPAPAPTPDPAPDPTTQTCPNGTVIPISQTCRTAKTGVAKGAAKKAAH